MEEPVADDKMCYMCRSMSIEETDACLPSRIMKALIFGVTDTGLMAGWCWVVHCGRQEGDVMILQGDMYWFCEPM